MKEKRTFKRFDAVSVLAVLCVLLVLVFESFFIFEVYRVDYAKIEPYLPGFMKEWFAPPPVPATEPAVEESVAATTEIESVQTNSATAAEKEPVAATNAVQDASEEPDSAPAGEESVPVG